ncbi:ethanolamine-phosphate cytidylyltransferase protein, putative [Cryptosporidium muris RN66]|uniref:ethanolamine-phosphate cytidylyltransferase n=1 Tax=Cryptosporidium muris (strain RN66) TaxID=441375 RepID=B6ABT3_CRYMR|nr:ethanolamine-phosphate cytidylyltransferase protein, putative [Cryptosporidium muris RN66]EEA05286.1 ethanolamine-phosphate cytidylyltransferase protein, putative [Cryptosporidium muris RN66]|eukprot:XP_002139635.1 ethanolamine-phosphate cytidylyltransferase protein [Cryptosporidium muris RN66]
MESFTNNKLCGSIYIDGVFDLMHAGHFNAVRQARLLGDSLTVGINSDSECYMAKGCYPIYSQEERGELMRGCKWVDNVVIGTPYSVSTQLLDELKCDYAAHGDDPVCCSDGSDPYLSPRLAGRLRIFKRTEGVSTTAVITRLLRALKINLSSYKEGCSNNLPNKRGIWDLDKIVDGCYSPCQSLISTGRMLKFIIDTREDENNRKNFTDNCLALSRSSSPKKVCNEVIYVDGSFDILHVGHLRLLEEAKKSGGTLIVGIYDDSTVRNIFGPNFPILKMMERALTVLSLRAVDDVIFGAPLCISQTLIDAFGITKVISTKCVENYIQEGHNISFFGDIGSSCVEVLDLDLEDLCYSVPIRNGIFCRDLLDSSKLCTNKDIFNRVLTNHKLLLNNIGTKWMKEINFYKNDFPDGQTN